MAFKVSRLHFSYVDVFLEIYNAKASLSIFLKNSIVLSQYCLYSLLCLNILFINAIYYLETVLIRNIYYSLHYRLYYTLDFTIYII